MRRDVRRMAGERLHASFGDLLEIGIEAGAPSCHELDAVAGGHEQGLPDLRPLYERAQEVRQGCSIQHQRFTHADRSSAVRKTDDDDHRLPPPPERTTYKSSTSSMQTTP